MGSHKDYWGPQGGYGVSGCFGRGCYLLGSSGGAVDKVVAIKGGVGGCPVQPGTAGPYSPHPEGPWGTCVGEGHGC